MVLPRPHEVPPGAPRPRSKRVRNPGATKRWGLVAVVGAIALACCDAPPSAPARAAASEPVPAPAVGTTLTGRVVKVQDGDSLVVLVDGRELEVRVAEIDTPERGQDFSRKARAALSDMTHGKAVRLEVTDIDRYGRTVAHVHAGDVDVGLALVDAGLAWTYRQYAERLDLYDAEAEARKARRGIWSLPRDKWIPPWKWRREHPRKGAQKR